ncbi:MAG: DNA polymerase I [Oscillospiraceae bacterium]|jgi:DNA polymerase-1|nr:DNA polymerase I [Oscillospiraceae bacterium]
MKLLVLDGNSILNRAFYGIRLLTTKDGTYTNAIYGFLSILEKLKKEINPDAIAIAFDTPAKTFRHEAYEEYKAGRKGMPLELLSQLPTLKQLLSYLGYRLVECEGFEGDDIFGTLAAGCEEDDNQCIIATGDKDGLQLVSDKVSVRIAATKSGRPSVILYDRKKIEEEFGFSPHQLIDIKALRGDTSDNIPGVVGIGKKNASDLIKKFGTLDNIYGNIDSEEIKDSVRVKLIEGKESAYLSYMLGKIRKDVPISRNAKDYVRGKIDYKKARELMAKLELFSVIKRFEEEEGGFSEGDADSSDLKEVNVVSGALGLNELLCILQENKKADFVFLCVNKKITIVAFVIDNKIVVAKNGAKFLDFLKNFLENPSIEKRTHDVKSLFSCLEKHKIGTNNLIFDTFLAAYLLNPAAKTYDTSDLALEYGGGQVRENSDLPKQEALIVRKATEFSNIVDNMSKKIEECMQTELLKNIEIPLSKVLASMENTGFIIEKEGMKKYSKSLDKKMSEIKEEIFESLGYSFNIQSPKQLSSALFESLSLPHGKQNKRGYSTSADVLEKLSISHPVIKKVIKFRAFAKIKSTYCDSILDLTKKDGRIHTIFNQTETRTGRLSSSEPNLQNIPVRTAVGRELRRFFCAEQDCILIDADYSQIELRILAHIANDKNMIKSFKLEEDIHVITASEIFDVPVEMVTDVMRQRAKAVNFGIVYGISAFSLSKEIGVSVKKAGDYINRYFNHYSDINRYLRETLKKARDTGYVETLFGRRRYLPELFSSNFNLRSFGERVAMNMPIQGSAADVIKIAMIRVARRLEEEGLSSKLILQVHDELIVQSKEDEADRTAKILQREMETAVKLRVNLGVKLTLGKTWYDTKL